MKIKERRFSVPFCIFTEKMPDKAFRILCLLLSESDFSGKCSPGYEKIKQSAGVGSETTVADSLRFLQKKGWIFFRKRRRGENELFWMCIPSRFRKSEPKSDPDKLHLLEFKNSS